MKLQRLTSLPEIVAKACGRQCRLLYSLGDVSDLVLSRLNSCSVLLHSSNSLSRAELTCISVSLCTFVLVHFLLFLFFITMSVCPSVCHLQLPCPAGTGLETCVFGNSQTLRSGFNLNSQIAVSNSQLVLLLFQ